MAATRVRINTTQGQRIFFFARTGATPMNNQMPSFAIHQYWSIGGFFRMAKPTSKMMTKETPWRMEADFWVEPPKRVAPREAKRANTPARWRVFSKSGSITAGTFARNG